MYGRMTLVEELAAVEELAIIFPRNVLESRQFPHTEWSCVTLSADTDNTYCGVVVVLLVAVALVMPPPPPLPNNLGRNASGFGGWISLGSAPLSC